MKTPRGSFLTSLFGLLVLAPCTAQEPKRTFEDPFGRPGTHGDDPFGSGSGTKPAPRRGRAEVKRGVAKVIGQAAPEGEINPAKQIRNELANQTTISFIEVPLSSAACQLSETHEIPILIDSRALEEIGLSSDETVNLSVKNISLRSALRLLLNGMQLTYMIRDEVLVITTAESAEQNLSLRVFPLSPTFVGSEEEIVRAVQATVVPDIWQSLGGPASIVRVKNTLVVSATEQVLEEVDSLLESLAAAVKETADSRRAPINAKGH
jgi:type II secretory pathway component GspD/PulD (secretin)